MGEGLQRAGHTGCSARRVFVVAKVNAWAGERVKGGAPEPKSPVASFLKQLREDCSVHLVIYLCLYDEPLQLCSIPIQRFIIHWYRPHNQTLTTSVLDCIYRAHKAQHAPIMMTLPFNAIAYGNLAICDAAEPDVPRM